MLSSEEIKRHLDTSWAGCNILYKDVTGSTNTDAAELSKEGAPHGTLVVADKQESGRGSRGRGWETPAGSNIAMSMVLRPKAPLQAIPMITLVAGLSVAEAIDSCLGNGEEITARIKWPNDVVINGRKICGILTETHLKPEGGISDVILGIGINVNMTDFPEEIRDFAGSVLTETGTRLDRNELVAACLKRIEVNFESYEKTFDLSLLTGQYEKRLVNCGEKVLLIETDKPTLLAGKTAIEDSFKQNPHLVGTALGITDKGQLRVLMDGGDTRVINAGEVSVRGIYGYV